MKTKIVIENGKTELILTPENDFDKDVLKKIYNNKSKFSIHTNVEAEYNYGDYKNHKLVLNIKETK
jgi:succinylarginine dihydrolase